MPELPEVETVRQILEARLSGQTFLDYQIGRTTFYRKPDENLLKKLIGRALKSIQRRGKYLILNFSDGETLTLHLGMSGRLSLGRETAHLRLALHFSTALLNFQDSRRFGQAGCLKPPLGPEPLSNEFNGDYLRAIFHPRRASVKSVIMNQSLIAGLGNIYATESLFKAHLRPQRPARSLTKKETELLVESIKEILTAAIQCGGSTLQDESYLDPLGRKGKFQERIAIYGKTHCPKGHPSLRTKQLIMGRRAYYCPNCQK